jgi:hypothetical protein
MTASSFTTSIAVSKSAEEVFDSITTNVAKWWGGNDLVGVSRKLNDVFTIHHPGAHYSKQVVTEFIPAKKVIWTVTESTLDWLHIDKHEWTDTSLIFEISAIGNKTVINFTHKGLVPGKECYEMCKEGWTTVIKDYLFHFIMDGIPHFLV